MENSSQDTKFCSNCRRDIAVSNYLMHTMHCQRNLVLCKRCNEPTPRNELDQHMQELHSQVPCGKCSAIVECCELEEHMRTKCSKRTIKCSFCDLECILDEMKTHEAYCGSRTEICNFCGQYVMIKEKEEHDLGNCAKLVAKKQSENNRIDTLNNMKTKERRGPYNKVPEGAINNTVMQPKVQSYQPTATLEGDNYRAHSEVSQSALDEQLALDLAREDLENLQAAQYGGLWDNAFDDETVPPLHSTIIPTMLGTRPVIPGYNSDEFIIPVVDQIPEIRPNAETTQVESDEVELPCEFCGELYPSEVLIQHQSGCNPEMAHGSIVGGGSNNNSALTNMQSLKNERKPEDTEAIPCEFCDQCFPSDYLIEHESQCRPDIVHGPPPWTKKDKEVTNESPVVSTYAENTNIPCEFCGELFPQQLVIDHQATCDANSLEPILSDELYPPVNGNAIEKKQQSLKHQEDPQLEEIASIATSNTFRKDRDILPITNKKHVQLVELGRSPSKELDPITETSRHNYSQSKALCDSKRKNIASNFPCIDSYFERSERNYRRLQKDKSLEDIFRRAPDYRSSHDTHPHSHTPFRERDNPFYSDRLHFRHDWSSAPAGARPKNCSDTGIQDEFPHQVSLSRVPYCIDTQTKPKFSSRLAATFSPLSENLSRGIRDTRPTDYSTSHLHLQPSNQEIGGEGTGKSKSMKRKGMDLHQR